MDLTLRDLIHQAISTEHSKNSFRYDERKKQEEQLLRGIEDKNRKAKRGEAGVIDLNLTLGDILKNTEAFLQDIDDFIAGRNNGKPQYARRFEVLLNYINASWNTGLSMSSIKKYLYDSPERRALEILKWMHGKNMRSGESMAEIAEIFGVDVKIIRNDFARLETNFKFLDTTIKIDGFDASYNSPVHPVFLAMNSAQLYALFYALKVLSKDTVLEKFAEEISTTVYSQLSDFGKNLVLDLYPPEDFPEDFRNQRVDSSYYLTMEGRQVVFRAVAYKQPCTVLYMDGAERKTVTGIPKIEVESGHRIYSIETDGGEIISIDAGNIIRAQGKRGF